MDQLTGNFTAEGNVNSSRLPDKDQKKNSEMLSGERARCRRRRARWIANRNRTIHYEGDVLMWQGANRIQADVDLDREKRILVADGNVVTNLWEESEGRSKKKKTAAPVLTEVRAPDTWCIRRRTAWRSTPAAR